MPIDPEVRQFSKDVLQFGRGLIKNRLLLALVYLSAVCFFAHKFASMDRAFYEDKIRLEPPYSDESGKVTETVFLALQEPVVNSPSTPVRVDNATVIQRVSPVNCNQVIEAGSGTLMLNVWTSIDLEQTNPEGTVTDRTLEIPMEITFIPSGLGGRKNFSGHTDFNRTDPDFHIHSIVHAEIRIDLSWRSQDPRLTGEQQTKIESIVVVNALRSKIKSETAGVYKILLTMPLSASRRLDHFLRAASGFTSDLPDNLSRMFYFSLTTITTLGFGDIVPITSEARNWVTFEALTGLLLMGLFLNSLAR